MFAAFTRDMLARGMPEAVPALKDTLAPRHEETKPAGDGFRIVRMKVFTKFSSYSAAYNARTGEQTSMMMGALLRNPGDELTRDEAMDAATALLKPPPDAVLDAAEYDQAGGEPFFLVRWSHHHQGVPVERDFLHAMFNGKSKRIFAWARRWHTVKTADAPR
jgi:hypothetical protein